MNKTYPHTKEDRLRLVLGFHIEEVRTEYLKTQDALTRLQLDDRNSDQKPKDFYDMMVELFNDESWIPHTQALPNLHDDYAREKERSKGKFVLTRQTCKDIILSMKPKILDLYTRYERSGNGANQVHSDVENKEEPVFDARFGHFDLISAMSKGGNNRANFLRHEINDALYWWHVLDELELLQFTCAKLQDCHAVTSDRVPPQVSYQKKRNSSDFGGSESTILSDLEVNMNSVNENLVNIAKASTLNALDGLKKDLFEVKKEYYKTTETDIMIEYRDFLFEQIEELEKQIADRSSFGQSNE